MSTLFEGLEKNDLKRLVDTTISIDKFVSKLGDDKDVMTIGFTVNFKEAAMDLMVFCENGYDWVLDSDMSSGELDDGKYIVFVEMERSSDSPKNIFKLIKDICNLTDTKINDWNFTYFKGKEFHPLSEENLKEIIPITQQDYLKIFPEKSSEEKKEKEQLDKELDAMLETAGIPIKKTHRRDHEMDAMRSRAGLL